MAKLFAQWSVVNCSGRRPAVTCLPPGAAARCAISSTAATALGFDIEWTGEGIDARAVDRRSGRTVVAVDPKLYGPAEVDVLVGDARKARAELGWEAKTSLEDSR